MTSLGAELFADYLTGPGRFDSSRVSASVLKKMASVAADQACKFRNSVVVGAVSGCAVNKGGGWIRFGCRDWLVESDCLGSSDRIRAAA